MSDTITLSTDDLMHASEIEAVPAPGQLQSMETEVPTAPDAHLPVESIRVNDNGTDASANLDGLVASIQTRGVLEPLIVTPDGRLLAGRRRLEAARRAGLTVVPVRFREIASERAAIEISLVENVERADLDPLTRAKSYRGLIEQGATIEEIASLVGQGTGHVYQHLALLDLHPQVQEALQHRTLSFADTRALVPLEPDDQAAVLNEICVSSKPLTSRQVKARVDAQRVIRLVQKPDRKEESNDNGLLGNYAALFEADDASQASAPAPVEADPLYQLNTIIAEMIAAAHGEDQVRVWARRLSHILEQLQMTWREAESKKKSASALQDRLL